jgi:two-component system, OmpR family, sensor kinase
VAGRRRLLIWAGAAYGGVLAVVAAGLLLLYEGARRHLDEALGQRLLAVASSTVHLVDGDRLPEWSFDPEPDLELLWLASRLERIRLENDLSEITLCDRDAHVLISAAGRLERGEVNVFWELDRPAIALAREGLPAASRLYRAGPLYQKSAHAPVLDRRGRVAGVLTVEGDADFLGALATLRRGAVATIAAVVAGLALLGWLLWRSQKRLERARARLMEQENLVAMGRLTAGVAHEIRNPLGIIRGAGQHLQRVLAEHGVTDEMAAYIPEEVDRLDRILGGYLAFGSDSELVREDLDLAALLRRTVRLMAADLAGAGVRLEIAKPLPAAALRGDPHRLQQILMNLLLNARDAMPGGGVVTLSLRGDQSRWIVTVVDTGRGLGDADPEQAFAPFWSTKEKGGGLGLTVSRRLAERHGGSLVLEERPDGRAGCAAVLSLPRRQS